MNNFVVLPKTPKSVKLNVRNLRELHIETAQLSQDNKDMENRLHQLREVMSREKEEREKNGAFHWKSAQTEYGTRDKEKKLNNKTSRSKMKIKVLKDEPLPVQRVPVPPPPKNGWNRTSRLKGKACGQCEAQTAGLVCAECAEDYCVGCFAKFHQKGALRFHHIIPMKAELHTSISTVDVVNRFQKKRDSEEEEDCWSNHGCDMGTDPECRATSTLLQPVCDNQMHNTEVLTVSDLDQKNEDSLLRGNFDEEESSRCFQQALNEWRASNTHGDREHQEPNHNVQTARPVSMEVMGTQVQGGTHIRIEFKDHGLSYMERLLLKKHRRTRTESFQLLSTPRSTQELITDTRVQPVEEIHESRELTAEEMDLHHYCISLFAVSSSAEAKVVNNIFKPCLSITEIDETAGDPLVDAFFGVKQRDKKESREVDALAMPSHAEVLHPAKPLDYSLTTQTLADEEKLNASVESFPQSIPSEQLLPSLAYHNLHKSGDISTLKYSKTIEHCKEHALHEPQLPKLLKPQVSKYPSKSKSALNCTTQVSDSCSSTSPQTYSPLISTSVQCQQPAFPVSCSPQLSLTHPECYQMKSNTLNLTMPVQSEEVVECQKKSPGFSQRFFKSDNETMLIQFLQSPPLDKVSSLTPHECQKTATSAILNSSAPASVRSHHQGKHTLQRHNDFHNPHSPKEPSSAISKSAVDWDPSLSHSLQPHCQLLSSSAAFDASFMPKLSPISPEDECTNVFAKLPNPSLCTSIQVEEDQKIFTQLFQSPRTTDQKPQTPRSSLKATSTPSFDSSHGTSPSTSIQCLSPAVSISPRIKLSPAPSELYHIRAKTLTPSYTKSFSQAQSVNTPSQSQPPLQQPSSDDEEPYFLPLGSSSSSTKSEILQISPTLCLSSSDSDMSSDSVGMIPTDKDTSDEEMRRCALHDMELEEERNTSSFPPSLFPTAAITFPSQSPMTEDQSGFFTKPCLAVSSLAQRHTSVSTNYQGLDGFFTLGLNSRSFPLSPAPSHTSSEILSTNTEAFMSVDSIWRPESSLQHDSEAKLVGVVDNNQPINITSRSVTQISKVEPSQRQSGLSAPVTQSVSRPLCASRPISRAALEILEVQSVEQAEITHFKQDEEDLLTITCLEEEFKQMNTEPNLFILDGTEDS
ncbi:mucin-2 [Hemibagrus wyckioides]|uniref:mucin-2 n=1 Tax=Hemibagrus wyckioides TaxID=337641 RepID=UPI00266D1531|nr:mucin-2 [Hemibagrus wyckioides]